MHRSIASLQRRASAPVPPLRPLRSVSPELRRSVTTEPEAITYDVYMDNHRPPGCSSFCDEPEEPASCCGAVRRVCCPCCPGGRPGGPYSSQDSEDSTTGLTKPPRPARSRRSLGASPIGRRNSDVAALAMKRTGSEIDVANFGCLDGSPVPAIGFDEAPRTP